MDVIGNDPRCSGRVSLQPGADSGVNLC
jgi:hypothetical protein